MKATEREGDSTQEIMKKSICNRSRCISEQYLDGAL